MQTISLKLDDNIFRDTENLLSSVNLSRNRYINEAILYYNELQKTRQLEMGAFQIVAAVIARAKPEAIQVYAMPNPGLLHRFAVRNDDCDNLNHPLEIALKVESKMCEQSSGEVLTEFESIDNYDF